MFFGITCDSTAESFLVFWFEIWIPDSEFQKFDKESQILSAIFCYVELGNSEGTS